MKLKNIGKNLQHAWIIPLEEDVNVRIEQAWSSLRIDIMWKCRLHFLKQLLKVFFMVRQKKDVLKGVKCHVKFQHEVQASYFISTICHYPCQISVA